MPHQCVNCGKLHKDASEALLKGCECGGRFFFYAKKEQIEQVGRETAKLSVKDKKEIEKDVMGIIGPEVDKSQPIIFNLESIRIKKPGKFEIDLVNLFKGQPLVYKVEEGKYIIDLPASFQLKRGAKRKE